MKYLLLIFAFPIFANAQTPDTIFAVNDLDGNTAVFNFGSECYFEFKDSVFGRGFYNPYKLKSVSYDGFSEWSIIHGDGREERHVSRSTRTRYMDRAETTTKPDTVNADGYFWQRTDARFIPIEINAKRINLQVHYQDFVPTTCGCYKKIGRSKVVIDWIGPRVIESEPRA